MNSPVTERTLFVLGAGVDAALGLPMMNSLLGELARFSLEEGKEVEKTLRQFAKGIRFNISKRAGEQAEQFGESLIASHSHLLEKVQSALDKHKDQGSEKIEAMRTVVAGLQQIRDSNHLDDNTCRVLAEMAGERDGNSGDYLISPRGITLTNAPRQAIRKIFQGALAELPGLTDEECQAMKEVVSVISNFEEMLGEFFSGFYTKHIGNQKKYFYLSWLLWAFLHSKQLDAMGRRESSFYKTLADLNNHNVITFNYTRFYLTDDFSRIAYFHGDCRGYIRFDTREYVDHDDRIEHAQSVSDLVEFLNETGSDVDWDSDPPRILLPAIVPPLSVKPIICTEYLDRWVDAGRRIEQADRIVIVGYSFNVADEHFNDLIRKRNISAPICLVNPDVVGVKSMICRTLGMDQRSLTEVRANGLRKWRSGRLSLVQARAEEITAEQLQSVLV